MSNTSSKRSGGNLPSQPAPPKKRRRWFRTALLVSFIGVWLTVLGTWFALRDPGEWTTLLANLEFSKAGTALFGSRKASGTSDLTYFGDGKAELGDFSIKIYDPITQNALRSDFHLEGNTVFNDQAEFDRFMKNNRRQFREQVTVAMRTCNVSDLANPDLKLLEKKLVSRVNRAMGR
ncbi:MAG TPA: hypothetical protein VE890_11395, partial [Thermoguttaceae bacterium]|nr:hypothetical protein [Thermoguttaceae bacterium]